MTDIDLTPFISLIIAVLSGLITAYVIPWLKAKTNLQQREIILAIVRTAVQAAEQMLGGESGQKRKQYVINCLAEKGFRVDSAELDTIIEAAVYEINSVFIAESETTVEIDDEPNEEEKEPV